MAGQEGVRDSVRSSRRAGIAAPPAAAPIAGDHRAHHTVLETEQAVADRIADMTLDMNAMAAVQNLYRAANAARNHLERTVLAPHEFTWTAWVVLWVVWIWREIETRHTAAAAGISKGTLTGVVSTLINRGLLQRRPFPDDARRVLLSLTPAGESFMLATFPAFNAQESAVVAALDDETVVSMSRALRAVVVSLDGE